MPPSTARPISGMAKTSISAVMITATPRRFRLFPGSASEDRPCINSLRCRGPQETDIRGREVNLSQIDHVAVVKRESGRRQNLSEPRGDGGAVSYIISRRNAPVGVE